MNDFGQNLRRHIIEHQILGISDASASGLPFVPAVLLSNYDPVVDGTGDNSAVIQQAVNDLPDDGGVIYVNTPGIIRVTNPIEINKQNVKIIGGGMRSAQQGKSAWELDDDSFATIFNDHDGPCFVLKLRRTQVGDIGCNGFECRDVNLYGDRASYDDCVAFRWTGANSSFSRGYIFERVALTGFNKVFHLEQPTGTLAVGSVRIGRCNIVHNDSLITTDGESTINTFVFRDNDCGENGYSAGNCIEVRASAAVIEGNILESCRDTIDILGGSQGIHISGNYFEDPVGTFVIRFRDVSEFFIGHNFYTAVNTDYKAWLRFSGQGVCLDPYVSLVATKVNPPYSGQSFRANTVPLSQGAAVPMWYINTPKFGGSMPCLATNTIAGDSSLLVDGKRIPADRHTIAQGSSGVVDSGSISVSGSVDQWVVAQFIYRNNDSMPNNDPRIEMLINGTSGGGSYSQNLTGVRRFFLDGDMIMITAGLRIHEAMTSVKLLFYPYKKDPSLPGNLTTDLSQIQISVIDNMEQFDPGMNPDMASRIASAPSGGDWIAGDTVFAVSPTAGGNVGWVCTSGGSPGTWKEFGQIAS